MSDEPRIRVTTDGPYAVHGDLPVRPGSIVQTSLGEPVEWDIDEPYERAAPVRLCRCGRSNTKPFCDDSHLAGFDGTEVADRGPTADRRQWLPGADLTLSDDMSLCSHAGFCRDEISDIWSRMAASEDPAVRSKIEAIVARCPSGRLALTRGDGSPVEPEFAREVVVERDGPYWVRGGVQVESEDGHRWEARNRMALCRCGGSSNKPFCDGTHEENGFRG